MTTIIPINWLKSQLTLSLNLLLSIFLLLTLSACEPTIDNKEVAIESIKKMVTNNVIVTYHENNQRANINLSKTNLLSMLPDLTEYPITLQAQKTPSNEIAEIFTSSEKAGQGRDGFYLEMARRFNLENNKISNGKKARVSIRKIASGLGAQFILAKRYMPDAFSPSNTLWGKMIQANGIKLSMIMDVTAPNTAGIIVKQSKMDLITTEGKLDIAKLLTNVSNGSFAMGYTNPYQSSTGLNFLLTILNSFAEGDESQMLSPDVASTFEAFQSGIPFVAQNTLQMRDAAQGSGILDAMVMEHQSWVNITGMSNYQFIPFGIRHDSPLYATPKADKHKREVLQLFAQFIKQQKQQLKQFGFGQQANYKSSYVLTSGNTISEAQKLWKQKKSGGKVIAAIFIADVSGSMRGTRLKHLKQALIESSDLINSNNSIGLITYSDQVNVDLSIHSFDVQQKSLFIGAVQALSTGGKTATNDAVLVASKLLYDFIADNPNHKPIIFVLSDGETNRGFTFDEVKPVLEWSGIPIHTIAYELQSNQLKAMASLAEGAYIESNSRSASYRIGNLLNSEM